MKRLPLFFIFTFSTISQEFHFDYSIESLTNRIKPDKEKIVSTSFYDSKNKIHLYLTKYNDKLRASIYNKDKNFRHSFKVTENKGTVIFEYTHTNGFGQNKNTSILRMML